MIRLSALLKGVLLAQVAVALFVAAMLAFAAIADAQLASTPGAPSPLRDTLALWPAVALAGLLPGGMAGFAAGLAHPKRRWILWAAAGLGYVLAAVVVPFVLLMPSSLQAAGTLLVIGLWASVAYSFLALPFWLVGVFVLDRWTAQGDRQPSL